MQLQNPREVSKRLKQTYQSVVTAAIDAKLAKLQNIKTLDWESIIEYVNCLDHLVKELQDAGQIIMDLEKRCTLLGGLRDEFSVIGKVIRMSDKSFKDAVSHLIVE